MPPEDQRMSVKRECHHLRYDTVSLWIVSALLFFSLPGCEQTASQPPPPLPAVTVVQPAQRKVMDRLDLTGNTYALKTVQLRARVSGYLEKVLFQDGQLVKKDQLLFLIQKNTYEANLQQAEAAISMQKAQLEYATTEYARYSRLVEQKAASQDDVDNWRYQRDSARANLLAAEAKRDLARLDVGYTEVRAPFYGRIDRRLKDPGNLVGSGEATVLAEINQIDPIYVYFNISDLDLARLMEEANWSPGQARPKAWPLNVGLPSEAGYPHPGHLDFASISLTPTTGTLLVRGTLSNPDGKILPGLFARVSVPVREKEAFLVPQEAVAYDQRGSYVLTVNEENVVQRSAVKPGIPVDHLRVIEEGLTGKEWVVMKGLQKAVPGRRVNPQREGSSAPAGAPGPAAPGKGRP
jgi:RND family efflux transporter MFP subunit